MFIDKLTVHTHGLPKVVLRKPAPEFALSELEAALKKQKINIPNKLKVHKAHESGVPDFVKAESLVIPEDSRVLGGKTLNFFS
ncbi:MAG: hypothetical protein ACLSWI_04560 [Candidatus Gastranaerophilaceae bacterium]